MSQLYAETFDPILQTTGAQSMYMNQVYLSPLVERGYGKTLPALLEKWELAPDALSWTLTVRKGIKVHNGDAYTAKDIKFGIEHYKWEKYAHAGTVKFVDRVDVVDDYTARLYTKVPQPFFLDVMLADAALMVPKDYYERVGAEGYQRQPLGTGPWKFSRRVVADMMEFEAVENHWQKTPEFKKLSLILIPEMTTRVAMLKTGGVDATDIGIEQSTSLEALGYKAVMGGSTQNPVVNLTGAFEPGAGPIGDVRVRQALSLGINREAIGKTFFHGKALPAVVGNLDPACGDVDYAYWENYSAKLYRYDPAEAKRLLKEAGYPDGFNIRFYSMPVSGSPFLPDLATIIQSYWREIGVKAELYPIETSLYYTFRNVTKTPNSQAIGSASIYRVTSAETSNTGKTFLNGFHTKDLFGLQGRSHPEIDGLIDDSQAELDPAKRKEIITKIVTAIAEMNVRLDLMRVPSMFALGPNVDLEDMPPGINHLARRAYLAKHR